MKRNDKRPTDMTARKEPPVLVERECPSRREPVPAILGADGTARCAISSSCRDCPSDGDFTKESPRHYM